MPISFLNFKRILYLRVNFVWTHKHNCCYDYQTCKILKQNRGEYVFERDPFNVFDENAIKILTKSTGKQVGHIPRDIAECIAPLMDIHKIDLHSVGGVKGKPCVENVEIPLQTLTEEEIESFKEYLEDVPYDLNRYLFSTNSKK